MNIKEYENDKDKAKEKLKHLEETCQWYASHPWEWEGSIIKTEQYRKTERNMLRLKALLSRATDGGGGAK